MKKGITLIALIITIIVMLILAGVSISLVVGDNGVITQAQGAKETQRIAEIKEAIQMYEASKKIEEYTKTGDIVGVGEYLILQGLVKEEEIEDGKITIGDTVIELEENNKYYMYESTEDDDKYIYILEKNDGKPYRFYGGYYDGEKNDWDWEYVNIEDKYSSINTTLKELRRR